MMSMFVRGAAACRRSANPFIRFTSFTAFKFARGSFSWYVDLKGMVYMGLLTGERRGLVVEGSMQARRIAFANCGWGTD